MADLGYAKRASDRREGRQIRSLSAYQRIMPFLLRRKSESLCSISDSLEVSGIERWIRQKRAEGWTGLGFIHLLVAAYVRTVSMRPGINRFVSGRRLYARNSVQVVLSVKRGSSSNASETSIKVSFSPTDTVFDVYRQLNDAIDKVKADVTESDAEHFSRLLMKLPRLLAQAVLAVARVLDYFDWLPAGWLESSPFHSSVTVIDMGSLGAPPVQQTLSDFGNTPCSISFGARRKAWEITAEGASAERHYVDYRITADERIVDSYYYASALKCLKYFMKNPMHLELPPEAIEDDVN